MSYSFNVAATSKADVKAKAARGIQDFVAHQQAHDADCAAIAAACENFIDAMPEPNENELISVSCHGSAGGEWVAGGGLARMKSTEMTIKVVLVSGS